MGESFPDVSAQASRGGGGDNSLSIEETNRVRAQLGLKPLAVPAAGGGERETKRKRVEEEKTDKDDPDVLRERLNNAREARQAEEKLKSTRPLGEEEEGAGEDELSVWVAKSRHLASSKARKAQKDRAAKMAMLLEEQDDDAQEDGGGVGTLAGEYTYSARDLAGLSVAHGMKALGEGHSMILTLEDQSILDEKGNDVNMEDAALENTLLKQDEKRRRARKEATKNSMGRFANDMEEEEEGGEFGDHGTLGKYDAAAGSERIQLGEGGGVDANEEQRRLEIKRRLQHGLKGTLETLEPSSNKVTEKVTDFYTKEEMAKLKSAKTKKKKKKIRNKTQSAAALDLAELEASAPALQGGEKGADHGSRSARQAKGEGNTKERLKKEAAGAAAKFETALEKARLKSKALEEAAAAEEEEEVLGEEDDDLGASLARARRVALKSTQSLASEMRQTAFSGVEGLAKAVADQRKADEEKVAEKKGRSGAAATIGGTTGLVLTETQEFVKAIAVSKSNGEEEEGARPVQSVAEAAHPSDAEAGEDEIMAEVGEVSDEGHAMADRAAAPEAAEGGGGGGATKGLGSMLGLLRGKGELVSDVRTGRTRDKKEWSQASLSQPGDGDAKSNRQQLNNSSYTRRGKAEALQNRDFDVNIDRYDEFGRKMTPKEAYRHDCWRFHGIKPSKNSTDKRIKQYNEEQKLKKMGMDDTPRHAIEKMKMAQNMMQSPYLVLSGSVQPGQVSDPTSGLATVERNGSMLGKGPPLTGNAKVEFMLGMGNKKGGGKAKK